MSYQPEKPELYESMLKMFRAQETEDNFKAAAKLYLFDLEFPRPDLLMAMKVVGREKGWK